MKSDNNVQERYLSVWVRITNVLDICYYLKRHATLATLSSTSRKDKFFVLLDICSSLGGSQPTEVSLPHAFHSTGFAPMTYFKFAFGGNSFASKNTTTISWNCSGLFTTMVHTSNFKKADIQFGCLKMPKSYILFERFEPKCVEFS